MRVRMTAGVSGGINLQPGHEHDFEKAEAIRLIEAGFAVPVEAPVERAVKRPVEKRRK